MNKPAFLVEGDLEQRFIQANCKNCPVQKINCNGKAVSLEAIAKRVGTLARLMEKRHSPSVIIVIFDREHRSQTSEEIENSFLNLLKSECVGTKVVVGVPDRTIESWILADVERFAASAGVCIADAVIAEGKNGKNVLRGLLGGRAYSEPIHGVAWLKSARASILSTQSASFRRFATLLRDIECWWLNREEQQDFFSGPSVS